MTSYAHPARSRHVRLLAAALAALLVLAGSLVLAQFRAAAAPLSATLFADDFEDGDTSGWSKSGGTWSITGDGSRVLAQSKVTTQPSRLFTGGSTWGDYTVQARVKPQSFSGSTGLVGLGARSTSSTSFVRLVVLGSGRAQLQSVASGTVTVLGTSTASYATGAWHTLRLSVTGRTATGSVDGAAVASGSTPLAGGRIALVTAGGTAAYDDLLVTGGGAPAPSPTPRPSPTPTPTPTPTRTTTVPAPPGSPTTPWPTPRGSIRVSTTTRVSGSFDGGLRRYYGIGDGGQSESQDPMFEIANGGSISNVILGAPAGDGIHCRGTCTLTNVWWEDVGEDAATFLGTSSSQTMTVNGGGARSASDKIFQHNGPGSLVIRNFQATDFGKLYRSCGNCSTSHQRNVVVDNLVATAPDEAIVGINTNFGDTARLTRIVIVDGRGVPACLKYRGVAKGSEPSVIGSGPDSANCLYRESDVTYR